METPELPRGLGQLVLVVDDEAPLAELVRDDLVDLGYLVQAFTSARRALAAVQDAPASFDAVVTDEAMPEMTGTALILEVRRLRPDMVTVLVTGCVGVDIASRMREAGIDVALRKPLDLRDLAEGLARAFAARA
jgi:DNA-binding NtrC family response regulator